MEPNQIITQARERRGLSPQQLGEAVGISDTWDLEAFSDELCTTLSLTEVNRLCQVLEITLGELLEKPSPKHVVSPVELRAHVFEECLRLNWSVEQFGDYVGWDLQGLIDNPEDYLTNLNFDGLQDICQPLGIDPLAAMPLYIGS